MVTAAVVAVVDIAEQDVIAAGRVMVQLGRIHAKVLHSIGHDNGIGHLTVVKVMLLLRVLDLLLLLLSCSTVVCALGQWQGGLLWSWMQAIDCGRRGGRGGVVVAGHHCDWRAGEAKVVACVAGGSVQRCVCVSWN